MNNFFKNEFLKIYKIELIFLCIFSCLTSIFILISPYLIQYIVDDVIIKKNISLLYIILIQLIVLYILSAIFTFIENYISEYLKIKIFKDKTTILLPVIIKNNGYFSSGDLLSRFTDNLRSICSLITNIIPQIVLNILSLIVPFLLMFHINSVLCLVTVTPMFLCFVLFFFLGNKIEKIEKNLLKSNSHIFSFLKEIFNIQYLINSYGILKFFTDKYDYKINKYQDELLSYAKYSSLTLAFECVLTGIPLLILIIFGTYLLIHDYLTLGNFIAFISYISLFFSPIMELGSNWVSYKSLLPAIDRIEEIYDLRLDKSEDNEKLICTEGIIHLEDVWFNYGKVNILRNCNIIFYPGINYLVGENGSGKSTILKLICKIYSPREGLVKVDNQDIKNISRSNLSKHIGIVFPDTYLFEDTIYNNIVLGDSDIKIDDVISICKKVNIHNFIISLPNQYDTIVNEDGNNFSSGEKQKISLARVLLRNPKILLLDEVTRSLDNQSKKEINECIFSLKDEKTIIIIDHNLDEKLCEGNIINV